MPAQNELILFIISSTFLFFILISFIITMLFFTRKQQLGYLKELNSVKSDFERELFQTQLEMQEEAFDHISLELHDNVGHFLALAKLHLTTFQLSFPEAVNDKIQAATLLIAHSLDEIRNISKSLNTEHIKRNGLIKTVQEQIEQLDKLEQFKIKFIVTGRTRYLDDLKEIFLFRIMQEAFNNIIRHSQADLIHIKLHYDEDKLLLSVHDNGIGFTIDNTLRDKDQHSSGLKNIIKRSSLIHAVPEIISMPGKGTTIKITTPY